MKQLKCGDTIKVHYTGRLTDGKVFDSSREREPLEFTIGERSLIAGFENGVIGMHLGETKTVTIPCDQAYGAKKPELIVKVPNEDVPKNLTPKKGMRLTINQPNGQSIPVTITHIGKESITLDANHHLAGEELIFEIEIIEII